MPMTSDHAPKLTALLCLLLPDFSLAEDDKPYAEGGNIPPEIVALSTEEETKLLGEVEVAEGFDVTLFSSWQAANYPVYVAAAPNGDLYVSSDGNGSLGRKPGRGRVLRLRDTNDDGRADEVTEFVKSVDAPRGLVWDHDRLYLLHPPDISVFFDRDGDGVAEASKTLVEGIAFDFEDRPPDHTTNGLELGIDGWIYIAGGDFGFRNAVGSDGRRLQHRAGGVIRFRPDGSGLEIFATGTRNILGTPMSPLLDLFARDNTNDGGGWDVRFHHFSGLEDHGYPRLYMNFSDEIVNPLADYGGGSGCGSVYISEPGFPQVWNDAPYTADWGTAGLWHHAVERRGATFEEIDSPKRFVKLPRPTDADADALSRLYVASWHGPATFDWAGPEHGFIVRVTPKGYTPEPLPEFDALETSALVDLLKSPSHIRRLAAQRALLRRPTEAKMTKALTDLAADASQTLPTRVAALYGIVQRGIDSASSGGVVEALQPLRFDKNLQPFIMRGLGDLGIDRITAGGSGTAPVEWLMEGLQSHDPRTQLEAIVASARQRAASTAPAIVAHLGSGDPLIAHTAFQALARLGAHGAAFAVLDDAESSDARRRHAAFALMRMHGEEVVTKTIRRLESSPRSELRRNLIRILARLYHREAEWKGDSWGTRPDTRGPYYELDEWSETGRIREALEAALERAEGDEAAFIVAEMNRNRIRSNELLERMLELAAEDEALIPSAIAQLAQSDELPEEGVKLLLSAVRNPESKPETLSQAIVVLMKLDGKEAIPAVLTALETLDDGRRSNRERRRAVRGFLDAPKLENAHLQLEELVDEHPRWAWAGLVALAGREEGSPESREMAKKAIDRGWEDSATRLRLIEIAEDFRLHSLDDRIRAAMEADEEALARAARKAAERLDIEGEESDETPKIDTLPPEKVLEMVHGMKGSRSVGESVFTRATCNACHTVSQDVPQKGPYLGNIAQTYSREELAEAILVPNKTIAQGFATNMVSLEDGTVIVGFVTNEAGDQVTLRDIAAQEHSYAKETIVKREQIPTSMMPPGLMNAFSVEELAGLLDYLEALAEEPVE